MCGFWEERKSDWFQEKLGCLLVADIFVVASKEFSDVVRSKRFIALIVIFGLVMTAAMATIHVQVAQTMPGPPVPMPRRFLGLMAFTLSSTMSFFAPVTGVALGCDTISGEREKGTLKIVLAQPVFRDTVINGKFLAATSAVSLAVFITSLAGVGASTMILGVTPTGDEALRLALFMIFSVLFTMTYYGISAFLSTVSKKTSQSVILGVTVWAVFAFVIPLVASFIALLIAPPEFAPGQPLRESMRRFMVIEETIASITPNYHFQKIGGYLLNPYATYVSPYQHAEGQEAASVTSGLTYAGPNILVLTIVTTLTFIASYLVFTRQEVR